MNNQNITYKFIKTIEREKKLTLLITNIFNYQKFNDYNYISRIIKTQNEIIIDIYDNISINRFNRYIFNFSPSKYIIKKKEENNVFITSIWIENVKDNKDKLLKLAYLFKTLDLEYAKTFLHNDIINILNKILTS